MVMDFFRGSAESGLDEVEKTLIQMLRDGRDVFDTAMLTVFGGRDPKELKQEIRGTDREINLAQSAVRRSLVVHTAVASSVDFPLALTYMSIVKDAERIGDYAKNIYDLARYGISFEGADDVAELAWYRDAVSQLIGDAADVFTARDGAAAQKLIDKADGFLDEYDAQVKAAVRSDGPAGDAVGRALYSRYLKRITAHIMNMMTSLVMPIDRLDYYDEAPQDRD
ncbi:MAG: hypothetical protein OEM94_06450 [Acidimicrobiia bacterium]|nr:hypothetical protein [Acidimicrobiia bacterium]